MQTAVTTPVLEPVLSLSGVGKVYAGGGRPVMALENVSLDIGRGEFCALLGASGSGKSTLLNIMGLLDRPTTGACRLAGEDVARLSRKAAADLRNARIGFVFQSFQLLGSASVWENVALPLLYRGVARPARRARAEIALEQVGLPGLGDRRPDQLSGGQRQRAAIARALIGEPDIVLADEPTGNLDSATAAAILDLFVELNRRMRATIVMVTHDVGLAGRCGRRLLIGDGRILTGATAA